MSQTVLIDCFFSSFDLHPLLQKGLDEIGFIRCTPIQALTLPVALAGRDLAGQAQTGTGKTGAFLVALMNRLLTIPAPGVRQDSDPRALVIAPTRELAMQIDRDARVIGAYTGLKIALIYGGVDYEKQRRQLRSGCDIVIATPGRLLDYYKQRVVGFGAVEMMVLDEADRMFDLGFIKDVRFIFRRLPARNRRQVLLFSATLGHRVLELAYEHMNEAEKLVVETDKVTADKVKQWVYFPAKEEKMPLLLNLLAREKPGRSIMFVNTRAAAERVIEQLKRYGYRVGALSGDVPQLKRQKLLQRFRNTQIDMLVCTDVAARGLHVPAVSHVFNYDLPQEAEDYVHRIGRTARLGAEGDAISFACDLYAMSLPDIEQYIGQKIPVAIMTPEMLVMPKPPRVDARAVTSVTDGVNSGKQTGNSEGQRKSAPANRRPRRRRVQSRPQPEHIADTSGTATTATAGARTGRSRRGGRRHNAGQVTPDKAAADRAALNLACSSAPSAWRVAHPAQVARVSAAVPESSKPQPSCKSVVDVASAATVSKGGVLRRLRRLFKWR